MEGKRVITIQPVEERGADPDDARIARLTRLAREVFRREDRAARWLGRPLRELGGISPLEMMETPRARARWNCCCCNMPTSDGGAGSIPSPRGWRTDCPQATVVWGHECREGKALH